VLSYQINDYDERRYASPFAVWLPHRCQRRGTWNSCEKNLWGGGVVVLGGGCSVIVVVMPWCESLPWFCVMVSKVGWEEDGMGYIPLSEYKRQR
jgi:hypothetical protein